MSTSHHYIVAHILSGEIRYSGPHEQLAAEALVAGCCYARGVDELAATMAIKRLVARFRKQRTGKAA